MAVAFVPAVLAHESTDLPAAVAIVPVPCVPKVQTGEVSKRTKRLFAKADNGLITVQSIIQHVVRHVYTLYMREDGKSL
jgi:hypothetical protein